MPDLGLSATSAWIVARPRDDDEWIVAGYVFEVYGTEPPEAWQAGRVVLPADGSTYNPDEYPELAAALQPLGFEPGRLPDFRGKATVWGQSV